MHGSQACGFFARMLEQGGRLDEDFRSFGARDGVPGRKKHRAVGVDATGHDAFLECPCDRRERPRADRGSVGDTADRYGRALRGHAGRELRIARHERSDLFARAAE